MSRGPSDGAPNRARRRRHDQALVKFAQALRGWLEVPLIEGQVVEETFHVAATGQTLVLTKRLKPEEPGG